MVLGFGAGSLKRPLVKKGPWWFWGLGRDPPSGTWSKRTLGGFGVSGDGPTKGPWSKRAPGSFGVWGAVLQGALVKRAPDGFGG